MPRQGDYFPATRHPWPCLLFLLPLLAAYELGVLSLGGTHPEALRNGADHWMRRLLGTVGLSEPYWVPAGLAVVLAAWSFHRRDDRPRDLVGVIAGMALESVAFALGLWGVSRALGPLVEYLGLELSLAPATEEALGQIVTFVGAGVYEETLFRLVLFSALLGGLRWVGAPGPLALPLAAGASAALFAVAHHLGPYGEPFDGYSFLFRTVAGVYFAVLYRLRGFGIAVGAHACYDVVVGIVVG